MMKIPKAKKLPSGNWFIRLRFGGEEICVTEATEKAAIRQATLIKAEHRAGVRQAQSRETRTVRQVCEAYLDSRRAVLSPSTVRGYSTILRTRFQGAMSRPASQIKDWQRVVSAESGACSAKTLKNAWGFVAAALKAAGMPVPPVRLPQVVSEGRPWLDFEQIKIFMDAVKDQPCEVPALLALHGLRRSEIYGLSWKNVDLKSGILHVRGAVVLDEHFKPVAKPTNKTSSSRRDVPLLIPRLSELLKNGNGAEMVCTDTMNSVDKRINAVCRSAGLPEVGVHGLRHSFASLCYHVGVGELETMELGGWSDPGTMRKIYRHLAEQDKSKAAERLASFFVASENGNENGNDSEKP